MGIQYLRALAAIAVVAYHACARRGVVFGPGAGGVDVFFVISGFVIWSSTSGRPMSPASFAWHRLARIVPLYWGATLLLAAAAVLLPAIIPHLQPSPHNLLFSLFFIPYRDPEGMLLPLLSSGWTLNYEMFFYALFGSALLLPTHLRLKLLLAVLTVLAVLGVLVRPAGAIGFTYMNPLLLEFGAGMILGRLWERTGGWPSPAAGLCLLLGGLVLFAATGITHIEVSAWRVVLWGIPAILVVGGTLSIEAGGRMPQLALAALLGDASYSIYLLHPLLVSALLHWHGVPLPAFLGACILLACAMGVACYMCFERPVGRALNHLRGRRPRDAPPSADLALPSR